VFLRERFGVTVEDADLIPELRQRGRHLRLPSRPGRERGEPCGRP
jgi:hypothetical protein